MEEIQSGCPLLKYFLKFGIEVNVGDNKESLKAIKPKLLDILCICKNEDYYYKFLLKALGEKPTITPEDKTHIMQEIYSFQSEIIANVFPMKLNVSTSAKNLWQNPFTDYVKEETEIQKNLTSFHCFALDKIAQPLNCTYFFNCFLYFKKEDKVNIQGLEKEAIYICEALVLVTFEPCFSLCNQLFSNLYAQQKDFGNIDIESSLVEIFKRLTIEQNSINKISIHPIFQMHILSSHMVLPICDLNIIFFFKIFTFYDLLILFSLYLQRKKILIVSDVLQFLFPIYFIIKTLLHPIENDNTDEYKFFLVNTFDPEARRFIDKNKYLGFVYSSEDKLENFENFLEEKEKVAIDSNIVLIRRNKEMYSVEIKQLSRLESEKMIINDIKSSLYLQSVINNGRDIEGKYHKLIMNQIEKMNRVNVNVGTSSNNFFTLMNEEMNTLVIQLRLLFLSMNYACIRGLKYISNDIKKLIDNHIKPILQVDQPSHVYKDTLLVSLLLELSSRDIDFSQFIIYEENIIEINIEKYKINLSGRAAPSKIDKKGRGKRVNKMKISAINQYNMRNNQQFFNFDKFKDVINKDRENLKIEGIFCVIYYEIYFNFLLYKIGERKLNHNDNHIIANVIYCLVSGIFLLNEFNPFEDKEAGIDKLKKSFSQTKNYNNIFPPIISILCYVIYKYENREREIKKHEDIIIQALYELIFNTHNKKMEPVINQFESFIAPGKLPLFAKILISCQNIKITLNKIKKISKSSIRRGSSYIYGEYLICENKHSHFDLENVIYNKENFSFICGYCERELKLKIITNTKNEEERKREIKKPLDLFNRVIEGILKKRNIFFSINNEINAFDYKEWEDDYIFIYFYGQFLI